jgi:DNA polymerase III alpha subunit
VPTGREDRYRGMFPEAREQLLLVDQAKARKKAQTALKAARKAWQKKVDDRGAALAALRAQKPFGGLAEAVRAVARTRKDGGGATAGRVEKLRGRAYLLDHPPSPVVDTPDWVAWTEQDLLGIALTCSRVDAFDQRDVNTTCKDYVAGRAGYMVFGVEVASVREVKTKKGKNPGQKMAFLTVSDASCSLADVIAFPEAWKEYSHLLTAGNCVYLQAERDVRQGSLLVKKVCQMER